MNPLDEYINYWRRFAAAKPPYLHADDDNAMTKRQWGKFHDKPYDFESYVASPWQNEKTTIFHTGLLPQPHLGKLESAKAIVLMTNPGFDVSDYWAEKNPALYKDLFATIHQNLSGFDFPFIFLDPKYCWHGGFKWWERKFRDIATHVKEIKGLSTYYDALRYVANHVAAIESNPYHSKNAVNIEIPSVIMARRAAQFLGDVPPPTLNALVICRSVQKWGVRDQDHVVQYRTSGAAQSASLKIGSAGGNAVLKAIT